MKLLSILVLFFCLNSTINAQKQKDLVTITGKVSDYDGNPIVHIPEHTRSLSGSLLGYKTIP